MERLDSLVAKVLADARRAMEERAREARSLPSEAARIWEGEEASALAMGNDNHHHHPSRRPAKTTTTARA